MDRVNGANTVDIGSGRRGFRSQNAAAGIAGTEVTDKILNDVQEEICAVVENAGLVLDPENQQQLWEALQLIAAPGFANRVAWLPVISMTTTAPPNDAVLGDAYIIPAGATGVWSGNQQKLAEWTGSSWRIVNARDGHGISLPDGRVFEKVGGAYVEKLALDAQSGKWSYAVAGGSANALTATLTPATQAYAAGLVARVRISTTNTADGPTLNLNGLGAKPIRYSNGRGVFVGELASGRDAVFYYDGTAFILMNPMLYFEKLAPKAARRWNAFTPGVALSDISGVKSANSAQSIASITGVTYLSVSAYCGVKNISTTFAGVIGYLVLRRTGQADQGSQYLGLYTNGSGSEASSIQQPMTLSAEFNNLDPTATYTLYLMVEKDLATGPIVVLDTYIRALSD
ncbi:DUF2793 domain-containing protein [Ochrobactrum pseudogrignonense]|uniref:DUF2793 domain-containing protein n=1 Tax=Brucella pseudogrignonensis TaxID=419475 RepID=A0A7Y3WYU9_9HYPH|nr:DUF2793 domain-containing protein [Brucella pseudogrignonensis]NNV23920.1 DUF2793 domain-containing protein [Brucella pseudogrignonensis]